MLHNNDVTIQYKELITIAIPAYKTSYLKEAISSALNQTYSNIEVIVVNDKSPHDVASIVSSFNDKRLKYYENEENIGGKDLVAQWNKCLSYAHGEYFSLLCDDDIYATTFVEEMLKLAKIYPSCNVFRGRAAVVDKYGRTKRLYPLSPKYESLDSYILNVCNFKRKQTVSEFMLKTQHIRDVGGYYSIPLAWGSDYVSTYLFAEKGGIASSADVLVMFRMSGENISSERDKDFFCKLDSLQIKKVATDAILKRNNYENEDLLLRANSRFLIKQQCVHIALTSFSNILKLINDRHKYNISIGLILRSLFLKIIGRYK